MYFGKQNYELPIPHPSLLSDYHYYLYIVVSNGLNSLISTHQEPPFKQTKTYFNKSKFRNSNMSKIQVDLRDPNSF